MEYLFTPWRMEYIRSAKKDGCVFCEMLEMDDREALILQRGRHAFMVLNRYPYNNGHFMSVPYRHVESLEALSEEEMTEVMRLVTRGLAALRRAWNPEGFNIGANIGQVAGAGVKDHVHIHVVPRWAGDTSFMPLFGDTRVIPQTLVQTYDELKAALEVMGSGPAKAEGSEGAGEPESER